MVNLQSVATNSVVKPLRATPAATAMAPDIASASIPDTLSTLHVDPNAGLVRAEVDIRRKEYGYNEVAVQKGHPVLAFLAKFWGLSAWMLELIMVLSLVLRKYSDLASRRSAAPPALSRRCGADYRSARACGAIRAGRSSPPGNWSLAISSVCAPATSSRRT